MVDSKWHAKLVDFGFATRGSGCGASLRAVFSGATPDFMSPETSELKKRLTSLKESGDQAGYLELKRTTLLSVAETDLWAWGVMAHAVLTCNGKLNSGPNSLNELQKKTPTALCRDWGAREIDEWARGLPVKPPKLCAAIAEALKLAGLQDGAAILSLVPHRDEMPETLKSAFKDLKPKNVAAQWFQVRRFVAACGVVLRREMNVLSAEDASLTARYPSDRRLLRRKRCSRPRRRCAHCSSGASRRSRPTARRR